MNAALDETAAAARPASTYRVQFRKEFGFREALPVVDYLARLGVTHLYASPVFAAVPGSPHGYDVVDPAALNPDLGGDRAFRELRDRMKPLGLGWLQDIVPNHMAFHGANRMLMDVFEHGGASRFRDHFDVDWEHPHDGLRGRILAPHLGRFYGECLEAGEIRLAWEGDGLRVRYHDLSYPLLVDTWPDVLGRGGGAVGDDGMRRFEEAVETLRRLPPSDTRERRDLVARAKQTLRALYDAGGPARGRIDAAVAGLNGVPGDPASFGPLDDLLGRQAYRLAFWKVAAEEINYRRFFNVNGLISMRVEREEVFRDTHRLILSAAWRGDFDGLRVDHVDGLYDPAAYLRRLRDAAPGVRLFVEKILQADEELPEDWPVAGTSGYDFLNAVNTLLCDPAGQEGLDAAYHPFRGDHAPYAELVAARKRLIIGRLMAGDVDILARRLKGIAALDRHARDITLYGLRRALVELLALFPVYRTYVSGAGNGGGATARSGAVPAEMVSPRDRETIRAAAAAARSTTPALALETDFIERFLLLEMPPDVPPAGRAARIDFAMRFQQLTGPLMAKGFEDTTLYVFNRLVSLNEVGGSPDRFGAEPRAFHEFVLRRSAAWPGSMNATSTHDAKRGEDVRARLAVLSEMPGEWGERVARWSELNRRHRTIAGDRAIPDPNDEYLLYQTILGAWPFDGAELDAFPRRIAETMVKSVREAKTHTAWLRPDAAYEEHTVAFASRILDRSGQNPFLDDFLPFQRRVARHGVWRSLAQLLLKCAAPGEPDFYQGSELWDLNLVDPDNRRLVDFDRRARLLDEVQGALTGVTGASGRGGEAAKGPDGRAVYLRSLLDSYSDGRVKLFATAALLAARRDRSGLFGGVEYLPLEARGRHAGKVVAFARRGGGEWGVAVAPIRSVGILPEEGPLASGEAWEDTEVLLPEGSPSAWSDVFTGGEIRAGSGGSPATGDLQGTVLPLREALASFPVALLLGRP